MPTEPFPTDPDGAPLRERPGLDAPPRPPAAAAAAVQGEGLAAVSDGMVDLLREFHGREPSQATTYLLDDLLVCVLRDGHSPAERTLLDGRRGDAVLRQRGAFQEAMRGRFSELIERLLGREVTGFMSGNQLDPDMMCELFLLAPAQDGRPRVGSH